MEPITYKVSKGEKNGWILAEWSDNRNQHVRKETLQNQCIEINKIMSENFRKRNKQ